MSKQLDKTFIDTVNQNLGIAHKVCGIYFQDFHEREDVLQEMMYQLWRSYPYFDSKSKFSTWMYKVCLNTALTWRRNNEKYRNESLSLKDFQIADKQQGNNEEEVKLLREAINTLSPLNKAIVLLYLEDISYEEIASILGISRTNVSVRLVRLKKGIGNKIKTNTKLTDDVNA